MPSHLGRMQYNPHLVERDHGLVMNLQHALDRLQLRYFTVLDTRVLGGGDGGDFGGDGGGDDGGEGGSLDGAEVWFIARSEDLEHRQKVTALHDRHSLLRACVSSVCVCVRVFVCVCVRAFACVRVRMHSFCSVLPVPRAACCR